MSADSKRFSEAVDDGSAQGRAGRMLRSARETLSGPPAADLGRLQRQLEREVAAPPRWVRLAPVFAVVLLVAASAAATTIGVYVLPALREELLVIPPPVPEPEEAPAKEPRRLPLPPPPPPVADELDPEGSEAPGEDREEVKVESQVRAPPTGEHAARVAAVRPRDEPEPPRFEGIAPPPPALPSESALAAESRQLAAALRLLRDQEDPAMALVALNELRARYPSGALEEETTAATIEALVALRRSDEALRELGRLVPMLPPGSVRRAQLALLQGELLAGAGRFEEALPLFDELVAGGGAALERALFGRATARSRVGDLAGCRADLLRYLELFPQGSFAARAHAELSR